MGARRELSGSLPWVVTANPSGSPEPEEKTSEKTPVGRAVDEGTLADGRPIPGLFEGNLGVKLRTQSTGDDHGGIRIDGWTRLVERTVRGLLPERNSEVVVDLVGTLPVETETGREPPAISPPAGAK